MEYVACIVAVAPLRKEASHKSEMVSQLLFGECATVISITQDFVQLKCLYDNYEGWCQKSQLQFVNNWFFKNNHTNITTQPITEIVVNNAPMHIAMGSFIGCTQNNILQIGNIQFTLSNTNNNIPNSLQNIIQPYTNTPYLWGGKSIYAIDCSGFTQQVFKVLNIHLQRDAYQQATQGQIVNFLQETQLGDLAFFDNAEGKITHVGILLNSQTIIHASGKVRVDDIDNMGIINQQTKQRTHQLRLIKRILGCTL